MIAVIFKNTIVSAIRIALGFLCTVCVASAAETGNIWAKPATVAVAKQSDSKTGAKPGVVMASAKAKPLDLTLKRHTSSFHGPPGPTLAVGARYVTTASAGLRKSWLDNSGQISEGEQIYDWPPGAKIVSSAPVEIVPVAAPAAAVAPAKAAAAPVKSAGR